MLCLSGCVVVSVNPFYDEQALTFDERLLGTWLDADDDLRVSVERSDWRSYRLDYAYPTQKGQLTGYLFKIGDALYLDLMPLRGEDSGPFLVPVHAVVRVQPGTTTLTLWPLAYDWFKKGAAEPVSRRPLQAALGERDHLVITAPPAALRAWLRGRPENDPARGPVSTFVRQP